VKRLEAIVATRWDHQQKRGHDFWVLWLVARRAGARNGPHVLTGAGVAGPPAPIPSLVDHPPQRRGAVPKLIMRVRSPSPAPSAPAPGGRGRIRRLGKGRSQATGWKSCACRQLAISLPRVAPCASAVMK
jgi:hypothetical protein